jgi:hypothetical protein
VAQLGAARLSENVQGSTQRFQLHRHPAKVRYLRLEVADEEHIQDLAWLLLVLIGTNHLHTFTLDLWIRPRALNDTRWRAKLFSDLETVRLIGAKVPSIRLGRWHSTKAGNGNFDWDERLEAELEQFGID